MNIESTIFFYTLKFILQNKLGKNSDYLFTDLSRQNLVIYGLFKNQHYVQPFYVVSHGNYHGIVHSMTW